MNKQQAIHRIPWIDVLRGIAILLMIPANFSVYFSEPHSLFYRLLSSYAAPTFIMVSAGMVILTEKKHNLSYYLIRGGIIMGVDGALDILGGFFPFTSFSVLYLIGISIPIIFIMRNYRTEVLIFFGLIFFVLAPLLQNLFGYHGEILGVFFDDVYWPGISRILLSWFVDGWFPIIPWLGYAFFGAVFFRIIFSKKTQQIPLFWLLLSVIVIAIGITLLFIPVDWLNNIANNGILKTREGYSEIFYPPTIPYLFSALGVFVLLAWLSQQIYVMKISQVIMLFGRYSMLLYILHQFFGKFVISPIMGIFGIETIDNPILFTLIILLTLAVLYLVCKMVAYSKRFWTPSGAVLQVLFGK